MFSLFTLLFVNFDGLLAGWKTDWECFPCTSRNEFLFFFFFLRWGRGNHTQKTKSEQLYNNPGDKLSHEPTVCANRHKSVIFFAK